MTSRIRRIRPMQAKPVDVSAMSELLKSIATMYEERDSLLTQIAEKERQLQADMEAGKITSLPAEGGILAELVRSAGKASNIIDPKALKKKISEADFYACITVSVTKAKEFLGQKELEAITTTIPGKTGEQKLKITKRK